MSKKATKKFSLFLVLLFSVLTILTPATQTKAAEKPSVKAHAYVIMDANSGKVLFSKNASKKIYPASTVKLMTALVTLEHCQLNEKVTITKKMLKAAPSSASKAGLVAGSKYTVNDLLHMLLLPSAADAATALAYASSGSNGNFIKAMNKKAKELGLSHSSFDNAIGLDIGDNYYKTYTCAKDFAILTRYAMTNETIRTIVSKPSYTVPKAKGKRAFTVKNTNQFLTTYSYNTDLYEIIGGKTGTTRAAGSVLITSAKDDKGHEIICAFFGNSTHERMYKDIKKLLNYTFQLGNQNKLAWKKGFWDVRFHENAELFHTYYDNIQLSDSDAFYPDETADAETILTIINNIAGTNMETLEEAAPLSIKDLSELFADNYFSNYSYLSTDTITTETVTPSATSIHSEYCVSNLILEYSSYELCSAKAQIALSLFLENNILPESISMDVTDTITKEEAVQIGDSLRKYFEGIESVSSVG